MTLYALDDIDDAIDATRAFLWPFDLGRWAKLAFVVFFLGGVGGFSPFQFGGSTGPSEPPSDPGQTPNLSELLNSISASEWAIIAAVVGVVVLIALAFAFVGAVMEFVFVESLRRERVSIRAYWAERWRQGGRLFGFRLGVGLLSLLVAAAVFAAGFWPVLFGDGALSLATVALALVALLVLAVVSGLVNGFTTQFVVPIMLVEDRGVLPAWGRFWPTLTGQWKQYLTYVVMRFVLGIAVAVVIGVVSAIATLALAIPFGIIALVGVALLSMSSVVGWAVIAIAAALFMLALIVVSLFVAVPIQTFLRYYALLVLGDTNDAFDLVTERRRAIRE